MVWRYLLREIALLNDVPSENVHLRVCGPRAVFYIIKNGDLVKAKWVDKRSTAVPGIGLSAHSQV